MEASDSRGDICYRSSGIWQSMVQVVSAAHLESLTLKGDMFGTMRLEVDVQASRRDGVQTGAFELELSLKDELGQDVLLATLPVDEAGRYPLRLHVDDPLRSPESPPRGGYAAAR